LGAIRKAAEYLMGRPRLGRDFFARGEPEAVETSGRISYHASLYDLLAAYARQTQRHALARVRFKTREVWSLAEARQALTRLVGAQSDWTAFDNFLLEVCADSHMRRSARASTFAASLELAREGRIEMRQERAFAPLWLRPTGLNAGEERAA
ncbi:MAG: segregation and condensation protein A, partial [Roseiarcus sp.]